MENENFEAKLESAKQILQTLMNPDITLDESVKAYEKGMSTIAEATKMLEEAEIKITQMKAQN
ncbi:MAG: exodeoxyribonuclease VII small subunit [Epsilonproteobacteria bacterium]|nr:exodeoxyribonuclease VII small subunit [Campylobacterota bacterium]